MKRSGVFAIAVFLALAPVASRAQMTAATPPPEAALTPAESAFVAQASAALTKLYPKPHAAEAAGYFRFNNEDSSGAISYINPAYFTSPDMQHPQQLWYDVNGRLLGADFSQTVAAAPNGPTLFGLQPARFHKIPLHVHYGVKYPDGTIDYGLYVRASDFTKHGLDPLKPTAADLVKLEKVKSADLVAFVFADLDNWDAEMWVIPNPAGPFADLNPNVKPSADQGKSPSERQT
jgi:hypothetical protein